MPSFDTPSHPDALWIFTGCHTPTGWACLEESAKDWPHIMAIGEPGPWAERAKRKGWITVEADILLDTDVDRISHRLLGERIRVFHPLVHLPHSHIVASTGKLLAAIARAGATVERFVLGGSACVWRQRGHRWSVSDDSRTGTPLVPRAHAYTIAELLVQKTQCDAAVLLRAAPLWDAPERGLRKRLTRRWLPQPKQGRAVLDPLCLEDFAQAARAALQKGPGAIVYGLPGPKALAARQLAISTGARVFSLPTACSELAGGLKVFGWDHDSAITMAWSLTLSGNNAFKHLDWEATIPVVA